jgi:hypothetical protein
MPRYFFHIHDGTSALDDTGTELPDIAAAQSAALQTSGEIIKQGSMENLWKGVPWEMSVTDGPQQDSRTFFIVRFSAAQK